MVDPTLVGSIKFGGTRTPHQWNSGGMPYDVVVLLERRNGPRSLMMMMMMMRLRHIDGKSQNDEKVFNQIVCYMVVIKQFHSHLEFCIKDGVHDNDK